jgi:hypothetical protein
LPEARAHLRFNAATSLNPQSFAALERAMSGAARSA